MHLVIEVRQLMFTSPGANLFVGSIGVPVVVVAVLVVRVQPPLVFALQFVVEDDPLDARGALQQPRGGVFVGAVCYGCQTPLTKALRWPVAPRRGGCREEGLQWSRSWIRQALCLTGWADERSVDC
jgi:hypothetical protein